MDRSAIWTAIFTAVLTVFTGILAYTAWQANKNEVVSQRAFVTFSGNIGNKIMSSDGKTIVGVQVFCVWQNGGATPTRNALTHCNWQHFLPELPRGFDFPDIPTGTEDRPFVIGPHSNTSVPMMIPVSEFQNAKLGQTRLYIWGWAAYNDTFNKTPRRLSEFCAEVVNINSTKTEMTDATGDITWQTVVCPMHNCYDEDCPDYMARAR